MLIERAQVEDAAEILALQKLAYQSEAELYQDYSIPPLTQTLDEIAEEFENSIFLKAILEGRVVGSVRACLRQNSCCVGRLIVHPDYQNRGIGAKLMGEIERCFASAHRYELFTGTRSERNLYLYQKLGYSVFRQERLSNQVTLAFLEKPASPANLQIS